jgi:glycosyltransferase involved in cell wall biosynthesis
MAAGKPTVRIGGVDGSWVQSKQSTLIGTGRSGQRLVIVSPGIPHVSRGASTVLFYHYIVGLKQSGFRIMNLLLLQPDNSTEEDVAAYEREIADGEAFTVLPCRADSFVLSRRGDIRFNGPAVAGAVAQAARFEPDAVLCFDLLSAWVGIQIVNSTKVAWLGDLRFQTEWYHAWYGIKESWRNVRNLPSAFVHCRAWRAIYQEVLRQMDAVVVSAKSSQEHLRRLGIEAAYLPYPWPDINADEAETGIPRPAIPSFLFLGTLTGLGSRSAFHFMLEGVYPEAVRVWGRNGFRISIAGARGLPPWVATELKDRPEFAYLGFVEDIVRVMRECHAVLVPIEVPVGNRSRILTAMSAGVPVIAHANAALGNPDLVDGDTCYLARDSGAFVERMGKTVEQPDEVEHIVRRARTCYENHFAPQAATSLLLAEVERAIEARRRE